MGGRKRGIIMMRSKSEPHPTDPRRTGFVSPAALTLALP